MAVFGKKKSQNVVIGLSIENVTVFLLMLLLLLLPLHAYDEYSRTVGLNFFMSIF